MGALLRAGSMLSWPAERFPDRTAITYRDRCLTFRQVDERVNRLANALIGLGLQRGDRVAVLLHNSPRAPEVRFALMKAGLCMVALNVRQAADEHAYIVDHSESSLLILDAEHLGTWERIAPQCPGVRHVVVAAPDLAPHLGYEELIAAASSEAPDVGVSTDDLERIAYTSGTTGRPKGIMKTIGNDLARMRLGFMNQERPITADDVMLDVAPLTHAARVFFRMHYLKGARNVILDRFDEAEVLETIRRERVTTTMLVPTMIARLVLHPDVGSCDTGSLERVFLGTAPMPVGVLERAIRIFGNIFRLNYGLSEATQPVLSLYPSDIRLDGDDRERRRLGSAGRPVLGIEVRIVDEGGREVPCGDEGEILIRGGNVMPGYWRDPEATRQALDEEGWLHTGDIARRDEDGFVYIVDRKHDMIISGGFNVYPREVEGAIETHPAVREVAVVGVPHEIWGEAVVAVVVPHSGASLTADEIVDACRHRIASYKKPTSVVFADELPKSFQGKILRRMVRERLVEGGWPPSTDSTGAS